MLAIDRSNQLALHRIPGARGEGPDADVFFADIQRLAARIDHAAFGLAGHGQLADNRAAGRRRQLDPDLRDDAVLQHRIDIQITPALGQTQAVSLARPAADAAQRDQPLRLCIKPVEPQFGRRDIVAVTRHHDHPGAAHVDQIDIVEPAIAEKMPNFAIEAIDIEPRLFIGRDDQAGHRITAVAPDRRIIGGVVCRRADRRSFAFGPNLSRRATDLRPGSRKSGRGKDCRGHQGGTQLHQKLIRNPPT